VSAEAWEGVGNHCESVMGHSDFVCLIHPRRGRLSRVIGTETLGQAPAAVDGGDPALEGSWMCQRDRQRIQQHSWECVPNAKCPSGPGRQHASCTQMKSSHRRSRQCQQIVVITSVHELVGFAVRAVIIALHWQLPCSTRRELDMLQIVRSFVQSWPQEDGSHTRRLHTPCALCLLAYSVARVRSSKARSTAITNDAR
jgi:hypothetical protein